MWLTIKSIFWTTIVCLFLVMAPFLGVIMTIGTIFYVVHGLNTEFTEESEKED